MLAWTFALCEIWPFSSKIAKVFPILFNVSLLVTWKLMSINGSDFGCYFTSITPLTIALRNPALLKEMVEKSLVPNRIVDGDIFTIIKWSAEETFPPSLGGA